MYVLPSQMAETLYGRCVESGQNILIDNVAEVRVQHWVIHVGTPTMFILQDMRYNPAVDTVNSMYW